ncbi:extracellular solute-binding protein [Paenibacillus cremeus]|uniref:Extracellular solute-binding protein n=1 Tax=Paenibacillus cremeus TaxID=2163881 RepID=A0A559KGB7_9BACL|nr:extracellular solute-binding protein [Paenibacillus cremeus]TVY11173.1 extracellular solute-binding protein [Paenibacillus cremeus]
MANKKKMAITLVSSLALTSAALLGCNAQQPASSDGKKADGQSQSQPNASDKKTDGKLLSEPLTLKIMMPDPAVQPLVQDSPAVQEIFKKTNVKLDLQGIPDANYTDKLQTMMATNNVLDVTRIGKGNLLDAAPMAKAGMFLAVTDYLDVMPNFKKVLDQNPEIKKVMVDGKLYGLPVMASWKLRYGQVPLIRDDIMKKLNLQAPTSFDELYQVLKKFKEAYPDSYPLTFRNGIANFLPYMAFALGSGYTIYFDPDVSGGKYVYGPAHPEDFKPVLAYLNKLYSEKLLDPDYAVNTQQTWQQKLSTGKSLFYYDNSTFALAFTQTLQAKEPNAKFEQMRLMKNAKGQVRNYEYPKDWWNLYAVSSKVKDPKSVMKFMDWMYSDEGVKVTNFGVAGEHYKVENGNPVVLDSVLKAYAGKNDPYHAMQSALGTGLLAFATYIDERPQVAISPGDLDKWSKLMEQDKGYYRAPLDPPFTKEELDKLKQLKSQVDTAVQQEMDKFIMGTRSLNEYDDFAKQIVSKGALDIEKIYNDANARLK